MASPAIAILATLDTKSGEAVFLAEEFERLGWRARIIDIGLNPGEGGRADVPCAAVAAAAGSDLRELRETRRRDEAMQVMGQGASVVLRRWHGAGELAGTIAVGGNQGTAVASVAMRDLPMGLPKLIVSTVASGDVRPYVGDSDIVMMFSVADLLGGPNVVTAPVLRRASAALAGMVEASAVPSAEAGGRIVAVTAFGNTHMAVVTAMEQLQEAGLAVVAFHASGACGSAMERLVDEGTVEAILDLTTHEVLAELYPQDVYRPVRLGRLTAAGRAGIPQVVAPGGLEYFCFGSPDTVPVHLRDRPTHYHNPYCTNVRAGAEELRAVAALMAERLNAATGPAAVLIPLDGWSEVGSPGGGAPRSRRQSGLH